MKKILLIVTVLFVIGGAAVFADHPGGLGIGVVGGGGYGPGGGGGIGGLSLKLPNIPIYWAANARFGDPFGVSVTGDYYVIDDTLFSAGIFDLGWFCGVGGYLGLGIGSNYFDFSFGVRAPIGLSFQFADFFEIFINAYGAFGLAFGDRKNLIDFDIGGQGGLRVWLDI